MRLSLHFSESVAGVFAISTVAVTRGGLLARNVGGIHGIVTEPSVDPTAVTEVESQVGYLGDGGRQSPPPVARVGHD